MLTTRNRAGWLFYPLAAAGASLTAVLFFVGLLGLVFLPAEAQRFINHQYISITHCLDLGAGRPLVSLFWTIDRGGMSGWRHYLSIQPADRAPGAMPQTNSDLRPLSLAKGPGDNHALVGNWNGDIYSLDIRNDEAQPLLIGQHADGGVIALASSADGQWVLSQGAYQLHGWDVAAQHERWRRDDVAPYCFALRSDSTTAIVGTAGGQLLEIDLTTGQSLRELAHLNQVLQTIALSPAGDRLAVLRADGDVLLLDSRSGQPIWDDQRRHCQTAAGRIAAFSPCGTLLVTAANEDGHSLAVWSVATGERLRELRGHQNIVIGAAFAESGLLRSWGGDGTIRAWDLHTGQPTHVATVARRTNAI